MAVHECHSTCFPHHHAHAKTSGTLTRQGRYRPPTNPLSPSHRQRAVPQSVMDSQQVSPTSSKPPGSVQGHPGRVWVGRQRPRRVQGAVPHLGRLRSAEQAINRLAPVKAATTVSQPARDLGVRPRCEDQPRRQNVRAAQDTARATTHHPTTLPEVPAQRQGGLVRGGQRGRSCQGDCASCG